MKSIADMLENYSLLHPKATGQVEAPFINATSTSSKNVVCPKCQGMGFLRRDLPLGHPDFGKPIRCECRQNDIISKRQEELRKMSNLDSLMNLTFETFRTELNGQPNDRQQSVQNAYNGALIFARNPSGWLILRGGYGCGKTHLAAAIANHVVKEGKPAIFVVVPDLLDHLRATFSPDSPIAYDQRFEQIRSSPLLVLDDFGTHSSTQWAQEKLFQLFNYRYNAKLPTVITTNLEAEAIDSRIRSRMWDASISQILAITSADYRQAGVAQDHSDLSSLPLYDNKTFDTFEMRYDLDAEQAKNLRLMVQQARTYAENPQGWLILSGTYGCGKTHLAAAIANEYFQRTQAALFVTIPDLLDYLRAAFSPNSPTTYDRRFDEVRKAPFLVLDDLGTESATAWANEKLYQLFNYRHHAHLSTVITLAENANINPRIKAIILRNPSCFITAPTYTANYNQSSDLFKPSTQQVKAPSKGTPSMRYGNSRR